MPNSRLSTPLRQKLVLEHLSERGHVAIEDIAQACQVSKMTVRRDLDALAKQGLIERTHGGAAAVGFISGASVDLVEPAIAARSALNYDSKMRIARTAATLVTDGQTLALDVGSTTGCLAEVLAVRRVNIYTSSLKIAVQLAEQTASVYVPPGKIRGTEPSIIGSRAVRYLSQLSFDIAFIGVSGISERGFFDYSLDDSEVKQGLIAHSRKRVVLLDSSKFNRMSVVCVSPFEGIDVLITDAPPPENLRAALRDANVEILIAP